MGKVANVAVLAVNADDINEIKTEVNNVANELKAQRQAWRDEINHLQAELVE